MKASGIAVSLLGTLILASAAEGQVALSLRAGTLGPSAGVTAGVTDRFNVRLDVPYFTHTLTGVEQIDDFDLAYDATVRMFSVAGIVDFHPFRNGVRLSAGAVYNENEGTFVGRSAGPHTVGAVTYSQEDIGELSGRIEMGSQVVPYVGLGFGNSVSPNKRLGFTADFGVMFQGPPRVSMSGTGMVEPTAEEAPKIEANLDWARYYPAISLGLTYRIF